MRPRIHSQSEFNFQPSTLKITDEYCAKYKAIGLILNEYPKIAEALHGDLAEVLEQEVVGSSGTRAFTCILFRRVPHGSI